MAWGGVSTKTNSELGSSSYDDLLSGWYWYGEVSLALLFTFLYPRFSSDLWEFISPKSKSTRFSKAYHYVPVPW